MSEDRSTSDQPTPAQETPALEAPPPPRAMKTDDELKALARDIYQGRVFTSSHIADPRDVGLVFMVLSLGAKIPPDTAFVYEYLDKAGERSINGYPTFFSCKLLNQAETEKLIGYFNAIKNAVEQAISPALSPAPSAPIEGT
ncbi:MAG TPA: hypothetical protein VK797_22610 [Tepidisphaeraceae bacterium]|jgi:hypothetical protein|nr:hypothetical protein [Tepidisphaeraceae bacterium]